MEDKVYTIIYRGTDLGTMRHCVVVACNIRGQDFEAANVAVLPMAERRNVRLDGYVQHVFEYNGGMGHLMIFDNHAVAGCSAGGILDIEPDTTGGMPVVLRYWEEDDSSEDAIRYGSAFREK